MPFINRCGSGMSGGFKLKQLQLVATDPIDNVLTFALDDFDPSQDYIKFIFGERDIETSQVIVDMENISNQIVHFHGSVDENSTNLLPVVDEPLHLNWTVLGVAASSGVKLCTGDAVNEALNMFYDGNGQFRIYYSVTNTFGFYFGMNKTYNLYVVYGH